MRLTALRLHDVRRFADRGVAIEGIASGVNVLCAANEYGKSTCFDALQALFFLSHASEAAAVQALRPYSGGQPLIEADVATGSGRFRLAKQFAGRRRATVTDLASGRIVAQAGEAEDFIASLVRTGPGGPAGLLWVRQGNTGPDRRGRDDDERRAREGVLSSVRGEVEAMTGGRRMADAMRACTEDLGRLVTPTGRPKTGGPYAAAIAERDRLADEERKLQGEADVLRAALDRRREARRRLAEITTPDEEAARREALGRAEAEHRLASAGRDAAMAALAEARHLDQVRETAARALDTFRASLAEIDAAHRRHAEALLQRNEIAERRRRIVEASETQRATTFQAERDEAEAKAILARFDRALRARADGERRAALDAMLAQVREARDEIERLEALTRTLTIPAGEIAALARIEAEIVGLKAALALKSAHASIAYEAGAEGRVQLDGVPLAEGEERPLPAAAELTIHGVGRITVRAPLAADETRRLEEAERDLAARLGRLGVANLGAAHAREAASRERRLDLEVARQRLAFLAPGGIALLQDERTRLGPEEPMAETELRADPEAARSTLSIAEGRALRARASEREAWADRERADGDLISAEAALARTAAELDASNAALGPEAEQARRLIALERELATATEAARAAGRQAEAMGDAITQLPRAEAALRRAASAAEAATVETSRLREEIADLSGQIRARSEDGVDEALAEAVEAHRAAATEAERVAREVAVLTRLRDTLKTARVSAREHYFEPVMRELTPLLDLVFDDASVVFDDATLLPRHVRRNGLEEPVGALSGGAREQLAVLTRLAFGRLLAREGHPAPVILDDALVYSDDERIERMFDVLHRQADDQQILVFSCRQRAFARLGGTVLQMTPWRPTE